MDVEADVVSLFPNGDVRDGASLECRATTYLIYLSAAGSLVTIRLPQWQREIWDQLETFDVVDVDRISRARVLANAVSLDKAQRRCREGTVHVRADSGRTAIDRRPEAASLVVSGDGVTWAIGTRS